MKRSEYFRLRMQEAQDFARKMEARAALGDPFSALDAKMARNEAEQYRAWIERPMIDICTINHGFEDWKRITISYDEEERKLFDGEEYIDSPELGTVWEAEEYAQALWYEDVWDLKWIEI